MLKQSTRFFISENIKSLWLSKKQPLHLSLGQN